MISIKDYIFNHRSTKDKVKSFLEIFFLIFGFVPIGGGGAGVTIEKDSYTNYQSLTTISNLYKQNSIVSIPPYLYSITAYNNAYKNNFGVLTTKEQISFLNEKKEEKSNFYTTYPTYDVYKSKMESSGIKDSTQIKNSYDLYTAIYSIVYLNNADQTWLIVSAVILSIGVVMVIASFIGMFVVKKDKEIDEWVANNTDKIKDYL